MILTAKSFLGDNPRAVKWNREKWNGFKQPLVNTGHLCESQKGREFNLYKQWVEKSNRRVCEVYAVGLE